MPAFTNLALKGRIKLSVFLKRMNASAAHIFARTLFAFLCRRHLSVFLLEVDDPKNQEAYG